MKVTSSASLMVFVSYLGQYYLQLSKFLNMQHDSSLHQPTKIQANSQSASFQDSLLLQNSLLVISKYSRQCGVSLDKASTVEVACRNDLPSDEALRTEFDKWVRFATRGKTYSDATFRHLLHIFRI